MGARSTTRTGLFVTVGVTLALVALSLPRPWSSPSVNGGPLAVTKQGRLQGEPAAKGLPAQAARFEANMGQTDAQVRFLARGPGYALFLTPGEAVLTLGTPNKGPAGSGGGRGPVVRMRAVGADPQPEMVGDDRLPGTTSYFRGSDPSTWRTGIPSYGRVRYRQVYHGVDLVYHGGEGQLEYDFEIAPGTDPAAIALEFDGADRVVTDASGDLLLSTPSGSVRQKRPLIYQERDGRREPVPGRYVVEGERLVRFGMGAFDRTRPLVIDPVLSYSSYLGSDGDDQGRAVAVHSSGSTYLTGETKSANFPTTELTAAQPTWADNDDVFVTKLDTSRPGSAALVYSTYLGGSADDLGAGIAVDSSGRAWVTGQTNSRGPHGFPTTMGAYQGALAAPPPVAAGEPPPAPDAFVALIDTGGSGAASLLYSSYLGGAGPNPNNPAVGVDVGTGIAVDPAGNAWVTGHTNSEHFPTTPGSLKPARVGFNPSAPDDDAFVARFDARQSGPNSLLSSTYLGGSDADAGTGIGSDSSGNAYVTGRTRSSNFPTDNAFQGQAGGGYEAFVTKLDPASRSALYSTFLGGTGNDVGNAIAVTASGRAYVTGQTFSATDFPTTTSGYRRSRSGAESGSDAFVATLDTAAVGPASLAYSTYLGGASIGDLVVIDDRGHGERGTGIAVDAGGRALVTGETSSPTFPTTTGSFQADKPGVGAGDRDAFVAKIDPLAAGPASLAYSSFLGAENEDVATGVATDSSGNAHVTGYTRSRDLPLVPGAFQDHNAGGVDAFVAAVTPVAALTPRVTGVNPGGGPPSGGTEVTIDGTNLTGAVGVNFGAVAAKTFRVVNDNQIIAVSPPQLAGTVAISVVTGQASSFLTPAARFFYGDEGKWSAARPSSTVRFGHTATLLADGRVLVVGGSGGDKKVTSTAELYDPKSGGWTPTGPLATGRAMHTATLLTDGRVLVTGGFADTVLGGTSLSSAELYDPKAGTWAAAAEMRDGRYGHTATLLPGGKVLVAGGANRTKAGIGSPTGDRSAIGSAELFDPGAGGWTAVGSLGAARYGHSATLLHDGMVLVVGGAESANPEFPGARVLDSAEVYRPATASWSPTCPPPPTPDPDKPPPDPCVPGGRPGARLFHTATALPDGRVLVAGGLVSLSSGAPTATVKLYNPAAADRTKAWTPVSRLTTGRYGQAAVLLPSGRPFVVGGGDPWALANGEVYDPSAFGWRNTPLASAPRGNQAGTFPPVPPPVVPGPTATVRGPTATLLSGEPNAFAVNSSCADNCGKVLVVGGAGDTSAELYTPAPSVGAVNPRTGPPEGGTPVTITGTGFTHGVREVRFGGVPAQSFTVTGYGEIRAVTPPAPANRSADVVVIGDSGTGTGSRLFTFKGPPDEVRDLVATPVSDSAITLTFSAPGSNGTNPPPAKKYVVRQSAVQITDLVAFEAATPLCVPACGFSPAKVGDRITLTVTGLSAATTYRYALRAQDDAGTLGPLSNPAEATTRQARTTRSRSGQRVTPVAAGTRAVVVNGQAATAGPALALPGAPVPVAAAQGPITPDRLARRSTGGGVSVWFLALVVVPGLIALGLLGAFLNKRYRQANSGAPPT